MHETKCMYFYGPPGTGKSTSIKRVLQELQIAYPECDWYCKMGMSKFWDGYDNQPIVLMNDSTSNLEKKRFSVSRTKSQLDLTLWRSKGDGCMQFDSHLVIMISNEHPNVLAESAGRSREAIKDRLTGSRSLLNCAHKIMTKFRAREFLCSKLIHILKQFLEHRNIVPHIDEYKVFQCMLVVDTFVMSVN